VVRALIGAGMMYGSFVVSSDNSVTQVIWTE